MDKRIAQFAQKQRVTSICCVNELGNPYCFNCFFSFDEEAGLLYFKSSPESYHAKKMALNPIIAGTILPDKLKILEMKGIQYSGIVLEANPQLSQKATSHYYKKYPFAIAIPGNVFVVRLTKVKMTDNSNVFGKKIEWEPERQCVEANPQGDFL